jgi:hypothetical protein
MSTITTLPTPPSRSNPTLFSERADALLAALPGFVTETNTVAGEVNTNATTASTGASTATAQAAAAVSAVNCAKWVSGTSYTAGDVRWSPADQLAYRRLTTSAGTTDPSADPTNWKLISSSDLRVVSVRSSVTALSSTDRGKMIVFSGGATLTQTFAACSSLGSGWWCYIKNPTSVPHALDPNASETIDGMASFYMYQNEMRLVYCDGSSLYSIVITPFYVSSYYASDTFWKPPGYSAFHCRLWGGGGSGRKDTAGSIIRTGGGGGACCDFDIPASRLGASETITIGASVSGPSTTSNGTAGNNSSFAGVTAYGGTGGSNAQVAGGSAYVSGVTSAQPTLCGNVSPTAAAPNYFGGGYAVYGDNCSTVYGGAAGGGIDSSNNIRTHTSIFGGAGGSASLASSGGNGSIPGGGGGATQSGTKAGDGAGGGLWIWGIV